MISQAYINASVLFYGTIHPLEQLDELGFDFNELNELSSWSMWRWIEYVYVINVRYCEERDKLVDISDLI